MRMVQCKKCGKVYHGSLKKCPECSQKTPPSTARIIIGIIILILGVSMLASGAINWNEGNGNNNSQINNNSETSIVSSQEEEITISLTEFNKIQTGMSYKEVCDIIGGEGTLDASSDIGLGEEYKTEIYHWSGNGYLGANANVTFQGGKVISKAQVGLK